MAEYETFDRPGFRSGSVKQARVSYLAETYHVTYGTFENGTLKGENRIITVNGLNTSFYSRDEVEHIYQQIGGK